MVRPSVRQIYLEVGLVRLSIAQTLNYVRYDRVAKCIKK